MTSQIQLRNMVFASLMAALTAVGAYIAIPIGPVPIVLQNLFIMLTGLLLGSRWGLASVLVYLILGAFGLPIFAGGTGGIARFAGPTGGYLLGYIPAVFTIGWLSEKFRGRILFDILGLIAGSLIVYIFGVTWLKTVLGIGYQKALAVGCYPFLLGDVLKIAAAVPIAKALRPVVKHAKISERQVFEKEKLR